MEHCGTCDKPIQPDELFVTDSAGKRHHLWSEECGG